MNLWHGTCVLRLWALRCGYWRNDALPAIAIDSAILCPPPRAGPRHGHGWRSEVCTWDVNGPVAVHVVVSPAVHLGPGSLWNAMFRSLCRLCVEISDGNAQILQAFRRTLRRIGWRFAVQLESGWRCVSIANLRFEAEIFRKLHQFTYVPTPRPKFSTPLTRSTWMFFQRDELPFVPFFSCKYF